MFAKNAWIGFTKCRLLLMRIEEKKMGVIRSQKNTLTEKIESIDYTHLLGYPSEVVAAEVITMVKDVVSDHMDKIVESLEAERTKAAANYNSGIGSHAVESCGRLYGFQKAIEIVKGGTV